MLFLDEWLHRVCHGCAQVAWDAVVSAVVSFHAKGGAWHRRFICAFLRTPDRKKAVTPPPGAIQLTL
ncbi:MAG TPA: hypothetical protein VE092_00815 [Herbaspirillum sp.]|uniref:hypothetical protein n=1 Tax=Herbaspirillum sp. TaxID=1890675 RepID=UPI002D311197|nr:hypothetical protein [Herbaspirillum sp.]HZG18528.1 hypothetical protein [Herbaspirillum sp.]